MFRDGEQKVLDNYKNVIADYKKTFDELKKTEPIRVEPVVYDGDTLDGQGMSNNKTKVRVLTPGGKPAPIMTPEIINDAPILNNMAPSDNSFVNNNSAASFVLVVAAVITLMFLVSIITISALNMF